MLSFLKPRKTPSRAQDAASSPGPDANLSARGTTPTRDANDAKPQSTPGTGSKRGLWRNGSASRRKDDENSDPRCTTPRAGAQSSSSLLPAQFMTPPTRKPPETPQHLRDSRPNSQQRPYPRSVPRSAGRARDLTSADTTAGDSVKIFVRVRPFNDNETLQGTNSCVQIRSDCQISLMPHSDTSQYRVDKVFGGSTTQEDVFGTAGRAVVNSCLEGYNSCIFAYGQTGSGKTHTMLGALSSSSQLAVSSGLIPRIFDHLLSQMQQRSKAAAADGATEEGQVKHECHIGMLEIYNESITDLLCPEWTNLQIREDASQGTHVENLSQRRVHAVTDVLALLDQGTKNRHIGETRMNRESSRSHCVLIATIRTERNTSSGVRNVRTSRLNLVDLAGSEQQKSSGASGERLKEASNINKSLSILGRVINSLAQQQRGRVASAHIPYRDSKLTFLLQDSLGGNSKTVMIANISPSTLNITETQSTLRFAQRAKRMGNKAMVNEDTTGDAEQLRRELARVKRQIANCSCGASRTSGGAVSLATPMRASMQTPPLFGAAQGAQGGVAMTPGGGCPSPHQASVVELCNAVARALRAENMVKCEQEKCAALEMQVQKYQAGAQKRKMMDKLRDDQIESQKQVIAKGNLTGEDAALLVSDEINRLKAQVAVLKADSEGVKADLHTANARINELNAKLQESENKRNPSRDQLLEQVRNLQNLLLSMKAPGSIPSGAGNDGTPVDTLLVGMDIGSETAMAAGAEHMCLQKTKEAEITEEVKAGFEEKMAEKRRAHSAEIAALELQLEQASNAARQRQDEGSRVHDDLLEVRSELAKTRSEHESMYHQQLIPAQKEAAALRADADELRAQIADLEEQVAEATTQLKIETEGKITAQDELGQVKECLEASMSSCQKLKEQNEEQQIELEELSSKATLLHETWEEMNIVNAKNKELMSRNVKLEWDATAAEELRQSQLLTLSGTPDVNASLVSMGLEGNKVAEDAVQREHVIDVLRTEVQAFKIKISTLQRNAEEKEKELTRETDSLRKALLEVQKERDAMHKDAIDAWNDVDHLTTDKLALQAQLGNTESRLRTERQSNSDLRSEVRRAAAASASGHDSPILPPMLGGPTAETISLRDEVEDLTCKLHQIGHERDQLNHEVAMMRETITQLTEKSAATARASRASTDSAVKDLPPSNSIAGQFHAHTARIQELQASIQELEGERDTLEEALRSERDKRDQQAMSLRQEAAAVQMAADDDKQRTVAKLTSEFEEQLKSQDLKLQEVRTALKEANKAQDKTQGAQYIQNYTKLAAGVFQLAAWTYGESPDTTQISGGADENNSNSANSGFSQHILPPRLATLALQKGPAGSALPHLPWKKVADLVKDSGTAVPLATMAAGHDQLKSAVSDLLIWLTASNIDC